MMSVAGLSKLTELWVCCNGMTSSAAHQIKGGVRPLVEAPGLDGLLQASPIRVLQQHPRLNGALQHMCDHASGMSFHYVAYWNPTAAYNTRRASTIQADGKMHCTAEHRSKVSWACNAHHLSPVCRCATPWLKCTSRVCTSDNGLRRNASQVVLDGVLSDWSQWVHL